MSHAWRRRTPLPPRDGVDATRLVPRESGLSLLDCLLSAPSLARLDADALIARFETGDVVDSDGTALRPDSPTVRNRPVFLYRDLPSEPHVPYDMPILYIDDDIVVVDKPPFLATMPRGVHVTQTALVRLRRRLGEDAVSPAHRLDRLTAGVLLFTRRASVRRAYQLLFADRLVHKEYRALAPPPPEDLVFPAEVVDRIVKDEQSLRARRVRGRANARSTVQHVGPRADGLHEYRLVPHTGRTHQLRVHMASLGLPIANDPLYPDVRPDLWATPDTGDFSRPLCLLAHRLSFDDPLTGEPRVFTSRRPLDTAEVLHS